MSRIKRIKQKVITLTPTHINFIRKVLVHYQNTKSAELSQQEQELLLNCYRKIENRNYDN